MSNAELFSAVVVDRNSSITICPTAADAVCEKWSCLVYWLGQNTFAYFVWLVPQSAPIAGCQDNIGILWVGASAEKSICTTWKDVLVGSSSVTCRSLSVAVVQQLLHSLLCPSSFADECCVYCKYP